MYTCSLRCSALWTEHICFLHYAGHWNITYSLHPSLSGWSKCSRGREGKSGPSSILTAPLRENMYSPGLWANPFFLPECCASRLPWYKLQFLGKSRKGKQRRRRRWRRRRKILGLFPGRESERESESQNSPGIWWNIQPWGHFQFTLCSSLSLSPSLNSWAVREKSKLSGIKCVSRPPVALMWTNRKIASGSSVCVSMDSAKGVWGEGNICNTKQEKNKKQTEIC